MSRAIHLFVEHAFRCRLRDRFLNRHVVSERSCPCWNSHHVRRVLVRYRSRVPRGTLEFLNTQNNRRCSLPNRINRGQEVLPEIEKRQPCPRAAGHRQRSGDPATRLVFIVHRHEAIRVLGLVHEVREFHERYSHPNRLLLQNARG